MAQAVHQRQQTRGVLLPWAATHLLLLACLVVAEDVARLLGQGRSVYATGLLGWDTDWYLRIADQGYEALSLDGLRFFPLLPLLVRVVDLVLPAGSATALISLELVISFVLLVLVQRLGTELLGDRAARAAVWATALAPAAFVLVLGYADGLLACLVAGALLAARQDRWWLAAVCSSAAAVTRPTGVLVVLALLAPRPSRAQLAAVVGPVVALAMWLLWVGARFGDPLLPYTVQRRPGLRGGLLTLPWGHSVFWLHLPWALLALALLVVAARVLPPGQTALAAASLLLAVTARDLSSFERYAGTTVPLLLAAGAAAVRWPGPARAVAVASVAYGAVYACLALAGTAVP